MKICSNKKCIISGEQTLDKFYKDKKSPDGLRAQCKTCVAQAKRVYFEKHRNREINKLKKWKKENPDKVREGNLRNNYGMTLGQFNKILVEQNNRCAICETLEPGGKNNNFCVDHCHKTNEIRALLCYNCNIALGMIKDSSIIAKRIVTYLTRYEKET